jgi:hypothetical protein
LHVALKQIDVLLFVSGGYRIHAREVGGVTRDTQLMVAEKLHQLFARLGVGVLVESHVRRKAADFDAVITGA